MRPTALAALIVTLCCFTGAAADVLLIPDSSGDKIWAFDPFDGSVLSDDYVPADGNMVQPINIVDSGRGTFLVSDENADAVLEYAITGEFLHVIAGPDQGLDALQGITVRDGAAYVGSRTARGVYRVDLDTGAVELWAEEVGTPRDIVFRDDDVLITNSDTEANGGENIEQYSLDGAFLATFHDSDGVTGIDFPQQLQLEADGNVIAAGFSTPRGLYSYDGFGNESAAFTNIITSPRGIVRLGNGKLLYAGGTRVMVYDPATQTEETVINQSRTSFRYIERSSAPVPIFGDVNRDGSVDVLDLVTLIQSQGPCPGPACLSDLNEDGVVDEEDQRIMRLLIGLLQPGDQL
ncbi:hypothetical protein ABI59_08065 [Acidobacteria bacterium Mor1]|nr:hypothetical protein ABI59_08065 [Acidobacteria bacterium Mor1]